MFVTQKAALHAAGAIVDRMVAGMCDDGEFEAESFGPVEKVYRGLTVGASVGYLLAHADSGYQEARLSVIRVGDLWDVEASYDEALS